MPTNIRCEACGITLLGIVIDEPEPIGRDACPDCGGTEFRRVADDSS